MLYGALVVTLWTCYGALQVVVLLLLLLLLIRLDSLLCRISLDSPHKGFWTLVLKLMDQSTEAMTGRPAL